MDHQTVCSVHHADVPNRGANNAGHEPAVRITRLGPSRDENHRVIDSTHPLAVLCEVGVYVREPMQRIRLALGVEEAVHYHVLGAELHHLTVASTIVRHENMKAHS